MTDWQERLTSLIREMGGHLVGYASLEDVAEARQAGYNGAVSIGVALRAEIVSALGQGPTLPYHLEYLRINGILDRLDQFAADWLKMQGFEAHPLTRGNVEIDWEALKTAIPHKTAALRAGHGWIGRSALLITPEFGPAVRFSTVLTNAPIEQASTRPDGCGACHACKDACPPGAIAGVPWRPELQRSGYYDAFACKAYAEASCSKIGVSNDICGICIHACPFTQRYLRGNPA